MLDLASAKKMAIVHYLLGKGASTQYRAKKELKLGMSIVNQTFNFLAEKEVLKKEGGKYVVAGHVSLLELVAFFSQHEFAEIMGNFDFVGQGTGFEDAAKFSHFLPGNGFGTVLELLQIG